VRVLHVFPFYPGEPTDGSAVYERNLCRELARLGVDIEILTTRTQRLVPHGPFDLGWPEELSATDEVDGIRVRRFRALTRFRLGAYVSRRVIAQWQYEDGTEGKVLPGSRNYLAHLFERARRRPAAIDFLAELGRGPLVPGLLSELPRLARDKDLVLVGYAPFALMRHVQFVVRRIAKPIVLLPFFHDQDPYHHFRILYRAYERADRVLLPSPETEGVFQRHLPASRPVTIGAGVETAPFESMTIDGASFRRTHRLEGKRILLFVGRKEAGKRYDLALAALAKLPAHVTLVMIGKDVDAQRVPPERVLHLGEVTREHLVAAYDACDVFLLPSELESFGMVFLEAWLRRKPVIGNPLCGAVASLIEDGKDGFLRSTATEIAAAVKALLEDPAMRRRMGEAGYSKVMRDFTWGRVAERTLAVYEEVLRGGLRDRAA